VEEEESLSNGNSVSEQVEEGGENPPPGISDVAMEADYEATQRPCLVQMGLAKKLWES
jgi:hypothetical protein